MGGDAQSAIALLSSGTEIDLYVDSRRADTDVQMEIKFGIQVSQCLLNLSK